MEIRQDIQTTRTVAFGSSKTGKTVTASVLDSSGATLGSGVTIGSVVELGYGTYGAAFTFTTELTGYIQWFNVTDGTLVFDPIVVTNDLTRVRKVATNRWKIVSNQLIEYDDDGTTPLNTYDLKKAGVADGDEPDERVPV